MVCDNGLDQWNIEAGLPSLRYDIDETVHIREECILFQQKDTQFNAVSNKGRVNVAKQLEIELYWLIELKSKVFFKGKNDLYFSQTTNPILKMILMIAAFLSAWSLLNKSLCVQYSGTLYKHGMKHYRRNLGNIVLQNIGA